MLNLPIYLDHAATTPLHEAALAEMLPYFSREFANPAAIYTAGAECREAVERAREVIADQIGARPEEVYFTGGGTEADNWALKGLATKPRERRHILVSSIEHSAVLEPARALIEQGFDVELLPVDSQGTVDPNEVDSRIQPNTLLVSVMHANNEVGTLQPVAEIGRICREKDVVFHSDAVQGFCKAPLNVNELNVDLMSISGHKIYGPKGVGALYVRRGVRLGAFMEGGEQERGKRGGTLNVPGIVGFAKAAEVASADQFEESERQSRLRNRLIDSVQSSIPNARLNGHREARLTNNAHFCFEGVEGEPLLLALDMAGVYASAGSACHAGSTEPSHVLMAMGLSVETARGALRLTIGRSTTEEAVDYTVERLCEIVHNLRKLSSSATFA